jgi:RHS repeat-associated protein
VAVGASGYAAIYTGSWAASSDVDSSRTMDAVSCVSTTFCVTGDTSGYSAKYTGSWATATDIDSSRSIKQVVCVSSSFCLAIDGSGYSATYTGSWATASDIEGSTALESLTCVSSSYCVASDGSGDVVTYSGSAWGYPTGIDGTRTISSVSCVSTTFCAAVDSSGYAITFAPVVVPATVSQLTWDTNGSLALALGDGSYYYLYGPGSSPVEQISLATSTPTYLTYSPSNSTWLTTNEAGDETAFYGYDAFGNLAFGTPSSAFGYAGQYKDAASGFSNLRNRYYDSATGQFVSVDPMVNETNQPYLYAGDDPVNGADPLGLHGCGWFDPMGCVANAADDVGGAVENAAKVVNEALPVINTIANGIAIVASMCAVVTSATIIGGISCGVVAAVAGGVTAATGVALYAEGRESGVNATLDVLGGVLGGLGVAFDAEADTARALQESYRLEADFNHLAALRGWAWGNIAAGLSVASRGLSATAFSLGLFAQFGDNCP